jgi:hypothetical protein
LPNWRSSAADQALAGLEEEGLPYREVAPHRLIEGSRLVGILPVAQALALALDLVEDLIVDQGPALPAGLHEGDLHPGGEGIVDDGLVCVR